MCNMLKEVFIVLFLEGSIRFEKLCPNLTKNVKNKLINTINFVNTRVVKNLTNKDRL